MKKALLNHINLCVVLIVFVVSGMFSSCSINKSVSNGGLIQKRKYNKGYYWSKYERRNSENKPYELYDTDISSSSNVNPVNFMPLLEDDKDDIIDVSVDTYASLSTEVVFSKEDKIAIKEITKEFSEPLKEERFLKRKAHKYSFKNNYYNSREIDSEKKDYTMLSVLSLVLVLAGMFVWFTPVIYLSFLFVPASIALGVYVISKTNEDQKGRNLAMVSLVIGYIAATVCFFILWYYLVQFAFAWLENAFVLKMLI